MVTLVISMVRDEADVIEAFVRHNLALVDRMLVVDNGSTDGTREILGRLQGEGLPLEVTDDPSLGMYQRERTTRLLQQALVHQPDWILPLDADELLVPPADGGRFTDGSPAFRDLTRPIHLEWRTFVPDPGDDPAEVNPILRLRQCLSASSSPWVKVAIPGPLAALQGATVAQGNHALLVDGALVPGEPLAGLLAHFPVRSPGQLAAKVVVQLLQLLAMPAREPGWGFHYTEPFALLEDDPQAFLAAFHQSHRWFAEVGGSGEARELAPFAYLGGALRYTRDDQGGLSQAVSSVARYARSLAEGHAAAGAEVLRLRREAAVRVAEAAEGARDAEARLSAAELRVAEQSARVGQAEALASQAEARAVESDLASFRADVRAGADRARLAEARSQAALALADADAARNSAADAFGRAQAADDRTGAANQRADQSRLEAGLAQASAAEAMVRAARAEVRAANAEAGLVRARESAEALARSGPVQLSRLLEREAPVAQRLLALSARALLRVLDRGP